MKLLLDTHIALWYLKGDKKLAETAIKAIDDEKNIVYFSTASMWEITIKHTIHPLSMKVSGEEFFDLCKQADFLELPVVHNHVQMLPTLKREQSAPPHNDPFDRIMLAQAKAENMFFVTHDSLLPYYNEPCVFKV